MRMILGAMIEDTPFQGARIDIVAPDQVKFREIVTRLCNVFGRTETGRVYDVWFERENDKWVIACSPVDTR